MDLNLTFFGQIITFCLFVGLTMKLVWPKMTLALQERRQKIADGLQAAEDGVAELNQALQQKDIIVSEAKQQAATIVEQAKKQASHIANEAHTEGELIKERLKKTANSEIEQHVNQAREQLRQQLAALVVNGTEKILNKNIDQSANQDLLQQLAAKL